MSVLDQDTRAQIKAEAALMLTACEVILEAVDADDVDFLLEMGREQLLDHTAQLLTALRKVKAAVVVGGA